MALNKGIGDMFTPLRGWITEGNEGNWPQDIAIDIENMQVSISGVTTRRFGVDVAVSDQLLVTDTDQILGAVSTGRWLSAYGPGENAIVVQFGNKLYVFREMQPTVVAMTDVFDLTTYLVDPINAGLMVQTACSYTNIANTIVVVNKYLEPFYLAWEPDPGDDEPYLHIKQIGIAQRIFESFSQLPPGSRVKSLTHALEFDLRGAGWPFLAQCAQDREGKKVPKLEDPLRKYESINGYYPALSELFYTMKITSAEEATALDSFSAWDNQYAVIDNGTGPAGKFLTMMWNLDTNKILQAAASSYQGQQVDDTWLDLIAVSFVDVSGKLIVPTETIRRSTDLRPTSVAALNGHVVYAVQDYNQRWVIAYSQTVQALNDLGKCYQQADPTAEEINDLVATDGGIIPIPNMGEPVELVELTNTVVVVCENGIWSISGGEDGSPFGATSYSVNKVSTYGTLNKKSIVALNGNVYFWTNDAIVMIAQDQTGQLVVSRLSDDTIRSWVLDRTGVAGGVQGTADSYNNRVIWTVPNPTVDLDLADVASTVLVLDMNLRGFFRHRVDATLGAYLLAPVTFPPRSTVAAENEVTTLAGDTVTTLAGDPVTVGGSIVTEPTSKDYNFLCLGMLEPSPALFFGSFNDVTFKDWERYSGGDGVEVPAYVEFPYRYAQTKASGFTVPYIHSFFKLFRESYPDNWNEQETCPVYPQVDAYNMLCKGMEVHSLFLGHSLTDVPFGS